MQRKFKTLYPLFSVILLFAFFQTFSQQHEFNQKDDQGLKQGKWRGYFESGGLRYEGQFVDDQPRGVFKYYYPQGELRAELVHQPGEEAVKATYYHKNQQIFGEGFFIDKEKDGLWRFFTDEGILIADNYYQNGLNHGVWKSYFDDGKLAEIQTWHQGEQTGLYERYYTNQNVYIRAQYKKGDLDGKYEIFYEDGKPMVIGYYASNINDKIWTYYAQSGDIEKKIIYDEGEILKEEVFIEKEDDEALPLRPGPSKFDNIMSPDQL